MAELNKGALTSENNNSFPNNNTGFITPTLLRTFNGNMIDSLVDEITYNADSASVSASISQLKNFSSSLDNTYATDAQLSASASTLQNNINSLSASVAVTDLAQSSSIAALQVFSSSLDATFATDAQLSASASTLQNQINLKVNTSQTSSMSVLSSSYAISSSQAITASFLTGFVTSASFATTASFALNVPSTASFAISASFAQTASFVLGTIASASYALSSSYSVTSSFAENAGNVDTGSLVNTSSFNTYTASNDSKVDSLINKTGSFITTGSSAGTQSITGSLIISGATFNGKIEAPALVLATTTLDTLFESTASTSASSVISQIDFTRIGAGPTGDSTGIRLQTISGSDTSGDTLFSRVTTNINRHTTTAMTGSVVNTIVQSTWATGSGGTRVTYGSTITANAQSASATITLSAGNAASSNAGGTASIAAGLIRIGTSVSNTISSTGSFGSMILVAPLNTPALSIRSGSFELTTPQGSGSFYSNCPITSSGLRINGTAIVKDLIISGTWGGSGSGSLFVENNTDIASISSSRGLSITGSAPTIVSGSLSGSLVDNLGDVYPSTGQAKHLVTLTSASMATLLFNGTTDANTVYFVI